MRAVSRTAQRRACEELVAGWRCLMWTAAGYLPRRELSLSFPNSASTSAFTASSILTACEPGRLNLVLNLARSVRAGSACRRQRHLAPVHQVSDEVARLLGRQCLE